MLYLTESDIRRLLPMAEAVRLMREVFTALARREAQNQPRRRLILTTGAVLHSMAGACGAYFGTKIYATHARHGAHFHFLLYDAATARPLALMEANHLGQIRTGAATGFATDVLASPEASVAGIIGSGFQARTQLEAIRAVRPIREARVWSRSADKREQFAAECSAHAVATAEGAIRGADVIVTATNSKDPVLEAEWVSGTAHVNAVGSNQAQRRELPAALLERATLIAVDSLEQARLESGDLILGLDEARWGKVVELTDVLDRPRPHGITIFKSNGMGLEDVAVGSFVYEAALAQGLGVPGYS